MSMTFSNARILITPTPNPLTLQAERRAQEAGRDGAAIFRCHEKQAPEKAVLLAERLLNHQCPPEQKLLAINAFNANAGSSAFACLRGDSMSVGAIIVKVHS
ncbi:MAG: hypothetical protein IAF58_06670 [Leptolyngbya sp.]|nr:hypothetical protein [Candidatus Melainabacteria bacterium]